MTTNYHRQFRTMASLLLVAILILGLVFHIFLYDITLSNNEDALYRNASAMADLTQTYYETGSMTQVVAYWMNLSFAARTSGSKMLLCDAQGQVLLCSEDIQGCSHTGKWIADGTAEKAASKGRVASTSMTSNIYSSAHLSVAVPVQNGKGKLLGLIVASYEMAKVNRTIKRTTSVFFLTALVVMAITLFCMLALTKQQNKPLRDLAETARRLGHGNLEARVSVGNGFSKEYEELAVAFNNMATSLQTSEKQRQEFVANVSHELKTPMTTIAGYMDGMLDGTIPKEQYEYYMQIISSEVRRLSRLVRSMLDISRIQSQGVESNRRCRFDICDLVGQTLLSFEKRITDKKLDVQVNMPDNPTFAYADPDAITQVIYNLLDNAVKFCNENGTLGIHVRPNGTKLRVSVSNTGTTISPEELPLVFDRFHKEDKSRSINPDGAGLGLYIVRTIICGHGEDISVMSRDSKTEFTFTLPYVKQRGREEYTNGRVHTDGTGGDSGG